MRALAMIVGVVVGIWFAPRLIDGSPALTAVLVLVSIVLLSWYKVGREEGRRSSEVLRRSYGSDGRSER